MRMSSNISVYAICLLVAACGGGMPEDARAPDEPVATPAEAEEPTDAPAEEAAATGDIVEVAASAGSFEKLVAAVRAAGLVDTLKGEGPFTVFAPSDEAFAKLPDGALEDLLKPENEAKLKAVLTYHVVPGKVMSRDVVGMSSAKTVQGSELPIVVDGDTVKVGEARVVKADIEASNGVIHVIDTVVMPK